MALNVIMLGPPGAGKGTQAERFARERKIPKVSTGDILREAVHEGTPVGALVKEVMDRGELVGDDVMIGIVKEWLDRPDARHGFILDGFPRNLVQAAALDQIIVHRPPLIIVDIVVPEAELVRRLSIRLICSRCGATATPGNGTVSPAACGKCGGRLVQRSDDTDNVVRERLGVYRRNTKPLVEYYRVRPTFCTINGAQSTDRVAADIAVAVEAALVRGARAEEGQTR
jgi:adenylate kinase